jgi:hypothetical protein
MRATLSLLALALIIIVGVYVTTTIERHNPYGPCTPVEGFQAIAQTVDVVEPVREGAEIAEVHAGPLLGDMLTVKTGLTPYDAQACAEIDRARQMELGGQYVQRTNNYRRDYPDNCSASRPDFVGSVYVPKDGVGLTVPCAGEC